MAKETVIRLETKCRYCAIGNDITDIYLVVRNGNVEGFCLSCYEKHLDDKRNWKNKGGDIHDNTVVCD